LFSRRDGSFRHSCDCRWGGPIVARYGEFPRLSE
jgi:hypothetical protein